MNLIIDVGNTNVKLAVFDKNNLVNKKIEKNSRIVSSVNLLLKKHPQINKSIISSVGKLNSNLIKKLKSKFELIILNSSLELPFKNKYKTPKTLGADRLALISGAVFHYPKKNVLAIDAGSCITYDFKNKKEEYFGGAISPGINMRYKSLNNQTANLPLLNKKFPKNIIGNNTNESIHSGICKGVAKEIDGVINEYNSRYKELTVILTGGDANFLSKQLKSTIFANSNFLLEGLNYILEYNLNR